MTDFYPQEIQKLIRLCLNVRKEPHAEVLEAADVLIRFGKARQDDYVIGLALYAKCFVWYAEGQARQACDEFPHAMKHLLKTQAWEQISTALNLIGLLSLRMGNSAGAMESFLQGLAIAEDHHLSEQIAMININLADLCLRCDAYGNAFGYILKAESLLDQVKQSDLYVQFAGISISECALLCILTDQNDKIGRHLDLLQKLLREYPQAQELPTVQMLELYRIRDPGKGRTFARKMIDLMKNKDILDEGGTEFLFYLRYLSCHQYKDLFYQISDYFIHALGPDSLPGDAIPPLQAIVTFDEDCGLKSRFLEDLQLLWKYTRQSNISSRQAMIQNIQTRSVLVDTERQNQILTHLADTDPLSGLPNRRSFNRKADEWFEKARQQNIPLAVEMIDIDHFKEINDTRGHDVGDQAIQIMAGCLQNIHDGTKIFVSRYGGDEFIVLYLGITFDQVKEKAIALRDSVTAASTKAGIPMTISQGIVHHKIRADNKIWDYTSNADYAMYYAKKSHHGAIMIIDHQKDLQHPLYED